MLGIYGRRTRSLLTSYTTSSSRFFSIKRKLPTNRFGSFLLFFRKPAGRIFLFLNILEIFFNCYTKIATVLENRYNRRKERKEVVS